MGPAAGRPEAPREPAAAPGGGSPQPAAGTPSGPVELQPGPTPVAPGRPLAAPGKGQVARSMAWTGLSYGSRVAMQLVVAGVLARLLAPSEFGLLGMAGIFLNLLALLRGAGLSDSVARQKAVTQEQLSAVFWYSVASGTALALLFIALAPAIAWIYGEPRLAGLVVVSSATVLISSFGASHSGILSREMRFRVLSAREVGAQLVGGVAAIGFALAGFGVYALVLQGVVASIVGVAFLWAATRWRPSASFHWPALRGLLGFGANVTGFQVLNYVFKNLDSFLVGKVIGPFALGLYSIAYRAVRMPSEAIHQVTTRVMFPALSRIEDPALFRSHYLEALRLLAAVLFLPFCVMAVAARPTLDVLFGPQWADATFPLRMFCLGAFPQVVLTTLGWIFKSRGRADLQFKVALAFEPVALGALFLGLRHGIDGVAVAYLATNLCLTLAMVPAFRLVGLPVRTFLWHLRQVALSAAMGAAATFLAMEGLDRWLDPGPAVTLLAAGGAGTAAYAATLWLSAPAVVRDGLAFLRSGRAPPKPTQA